MYLEFIHSHWCKASHCIGYSTKSTRLFRVYFSIITKNALKIFVSFGDTPMYFCLVYKFRDKIAEAGSMLYVQV